jgi:hypothetical protein
LILLADGDKYADNGANGLANGAQISLDSVCDGLMGQGFCRVIACTFGTHCEVFDKKSYIKHIFPMGMPSSRCLPFFRQVLLPPLLLLMLTCLYTSSTLRPLNFKHHLSFLQEVQCFSCASSLLISRSFLSLANSPTSSSIRDIVLCHNVLYWRILVDRWSLRLFQVKTQTM